MLKDWVKQKLPEKVVVEAGLERYVHKDWDVPPTPEAVVRAGLALTIEEAQAAIPLNKQWWGGSRNHVPLDALEAVFGSQFPATVPLAGKPRVYAKLVAADDERDEAGTKTGEKGYRPLFAEWLSAGLIT